VKDLPSPAFPVFLQWMSGGGRLLLASCLTPASLGVPVTNLTFVDPRGKITRDVDIPADKDADPRCNGVEIVKDDIYLLYGIYNPLYGGKNVHAGRIAVKKYREQDGTAETVFLRETAVPGRELFLPYYESVYPLAECNALDPRGGHLVYFVTHPDGKLDYVLVDLSDRTERVIATNEDSNLFFRWVKWLKGGKELMVTVADKGRVLLRIFDTKSGRAVADIPQKHHVFQHVSISPDGKKMAYLCYDKKAWNMVRIYDLEGRKPVTEIEAQGHLFSLTWLDGGRVLGVGKEKVYLFDTAGGAEVLHENPGR